MARLYTLLSNLVKRLNFLGLGRCYENLCDTTNMLLVSPKYVGATQRVYTDDATTLSNKPSAWESGTVVAYRQVMAQYASGSSVAHAIVMLYEVYPIRARVWINVYNSSWGGWKLYAGLNQGTMPSTANFNNYKYPANWWVNDLSTKTNLPSGASYGYLEVINPFQNGTNPLQRYTQYNSRDSWHRSYVNDAWSTWQYDGGNNLQYKVFTSSSASRAANSSGSVSITITVPTGYSFLCYTGSWSNGAVISSHVVGNSITTTATVWWRNYSSSAATCTFSVGVLFIRNH